ncbi:MAG: methyltransferase [Acidobacteriota bacterium]
MSDRPEVDYTPIDEKVGGYRASQVVLAANRLGVFAALGKEARSAVELADELDTDLRATRILCDALVALSVLWKENHLYRNSSAALRYLLPSSPCSRVAILEHSALLYQRWGGLLDSVREGKPVPDEGLDPRLARDKRAFAAAMADVGRVSARETVNRLDLSAVTRLLDIGAGPGLYALEFARRYTNLRVVILDDAETLEVAARNVASAGLGDRIRLQPGDAFQDQLGGGYDFIFLSNLVHIYSGEENRRLMGRCADALAPSGQLCIKDFVLDEDRTSPLGAALFAVNMLVSTERGGCYTAADIQSWLESAGLRLKEVIALTEQSSLVLGQKR